MKHGHIGETVIYDEHDAREMGTAIGAILPGLGAEMTLHWIDVPKPFAVNARLTALAMKAGLVVDGLKEHHLAEVLPIGQTALTDIDNQRIAA